MNNQVFAKASSGKREGDMRRNIFIRPKELSNLPPKPRIKPEGLFGANTPSTRQHHVADNKK